MFKIPIRREIPPDIIIPAVFAVILYFVFPFTAIIPIILSIFILDFFRDCERNTTGIENLTGIVLVNKIPELGWFEKNDTVIKSTTIIEVVK